MYIFDAGDSQYSSISKRSSPLQQHEICVTGCCLKLIPMNSKCVFIVLVVASEINE